MELNTTAREQLRSFGVAPTEWAQRHFGTDEWHGDACGCSDDRCIGYHHDNVDDCGCLTVLLTSRHEPPVGTGEQAGLAAAVAQQAEPHTPRRPFTASFEGWTPDPDDLEQWPNCVRVEVVEGYDTTFSGEVAEADYRYADDDEVRHLVEIDTNYKPSRDGNPVRLGRPEAAALAAAVLEAIGDTFTSRHLGSLRRDEAVDLMFALESVATTLQRVRFAALADLSEELDEEHGAGDTDPADSQASGTPVSKPIPALAQATAEDADVAADSPRPAAVPAADADAVAGTLEQQFADAPRRGVRHGLARDRDLRRLRRAEVQGAASLRAQRRNPAAGAGRRQRQRPRVRRPGQRPGCVPGLPYRGRAVSAPGGPCRRCRRPLAGQRDTVVPPGMVRHCGRGLCTGCHSYVLRHGDLADYERTTRSLDDTIADYRVLRQRGLDHAEIAHQLGVKPASLQRQLERARARARTNTRDRSTSEEYVL
ncbi:sigma-70 family RNA polymerase sigma factor [Amycolatopsis australiensis]|uniref:Uncharacterized protein n=1 Tax=Amycolatopsis australiensis TaxID=546364 RepID=A0A1K1PS09_9PSEU|nr:sigma-70 family RNA polymerase sigma factor [Amycolatopsis australiensis]SFW50292.1 hypothetical protein SAMN04489730_0934 [Amycolatopsis australiensis]